MPPPPDLDEEIAVLDAVVRAATADTSGRSEAGVLLLGVSSGSCVAVRYAATHPERVRRLVLYGSYADGHDLAPEAARRSLTSVVAAHWGLGSRVLADLFLPGAGPDERDAFARFQRLSASAEAAAASLASVYAMDVRGDLPEVTAPTLVVHRRDDHTIPAALGRDVAARVPGAAFVPLDGVDHLPWRGDAASVVRAVAGSWRDGSGARPGPAPAGRPRLAVRARGGGAAPRRRWALRRRDRGSPGPQPAHRASPRREHPHQARSQLPGGRRGGRRPAAVWSDAWPDLAIRGMAGPRDAGKAAGGVNGGHEHSDPHHRVPTTHHESAWGVVGAHIYDAFIALGEQRGMAARRAALLADAEGTVLEIGAGTGTNLAAYPPVDRLVLTEPAATMRGILARRVARRGGRASVVDAGAEALPVPTASVDTVVSTMVLCTVPDVDAALAEVARVLKPGGRLLFIEHVHSPAGSPLRRWQDRLVEPWAASRWAAAVTATSSGRCAGTWTSRRSTRTAGWGCRPSSGRSSWGRPHRRNALTARPLQWRAWPCPTPTPRSRGSSTSSTLRRRRSTSSRRRPGSSTPRGSPRCSRRSRSRGAGPGLRRPRRHAGGVVGADRPRRPVTPFRVVGAHTDSPNLRVKPHPDTGRPARQLVGVEVYGGALLNSWLDRDLGLSGRVVVRADGGTRAPRLRRPAPPAGAAAGHPPRPRDRDQRADARPAAAPDPGLGRRAPEPGDFPAFVADELDVGRRRRPRLGR